MFTSLFPKKRGRTAIIPEGRCVYAIGDIHGSLDLLTDLLQKIEDDDTRNQKQLVFLGDYVDRGPNSRDVIQRLIDLSTEETGTIFLKGNHEAAMMGFLNAPLENGEWLHWGGAETLESYGLSRVMYRDEEDLADELAEKLPENHRQFLERLSLTHDVGDYLFVHAGLKPGVPVEDQSEQDLLWIRKEFHQTPAQSRPQKVVVHGHHPVKTPQDAGWRINVDTGACFGGALSCVVLEANERRFLSSRS